MATFKKRPWTPEEDMRLVAYISRYGIWNWSQMPEHAGNYLDLIIIYARLFRSL